MVNFEQCQYLDECGLVAWRKENPRLAKPLPENGCDVNPENCGRVLIKNGYQPVGTKISLNGYGPRFHNEMDFLK